MDKIANAQKQKRDEKSDICGLHVFSSHMDADARPVIEKWFPSAIMHTAPRLSFVCFHGAGRSKHAFRLE